MPPYGYLLELHVVVALRTYILFHYGSVNTRAASSFMDTAGLYVVIFLIFFAVRMRHPPHSSARPPTHQHPPPLVSTPSPSPSLADPPFIGTRHPYTRLAQIQPMARGACTTDARCG